MMWIAYTFSVLFLSQLAAFSRTVYAAADESAAESIVTSDGSDVDPAQRMPANTLSVPKYDWTGPYVGAHVGYGWGNSDWTAHGAAGPSLSGSLDFFQGFDFSKGSGSYFAGFHGGYNYMLPSNLVLGIEGDVSFPNTIRGTRMFSSSSAGQASYAEKIEYAGTLRARIGYTFRNWLIYGTGGFAWTYDQFTRSQIAGTPVGGSAVAGTSESSLHWRTGGSIGAGIEVPFAPHWTTKLEYLFTRFSNMGVKFPTAAQRFESDLSMNGVRLGFNYNFASGAAEWTSPLADYVSIHGQTTYVNQYALGFHEPYRGPNSLIPKSGRQTWDATLYAGLRLWQGAEVWINPEIDQGFGLSKTLGAAGFPSGEAYKVGNNYPYARVPRMFVRQTIGLGGETEKVDAALNQFPGSRSSNRLVLTFGKFGVTDIFDTNKYAHDPRSDFLNWTLVDTGTFDYAADAWGFTYGTALEWYQNDWTIRAGVFDLSIVPNNEQLDPGFRQFQLVLELERRYKLWGEPGKIAITGYLSRGRMARYRDAVQFGVSNGTTPDPAAVRRYRSRGGIGFNVEQQVLPEVGFFMRAGFASGNVEPYEFTDVDRTIAAGLSVSGGRWGRPDDVFALAGVINDISGDHRRYLAAGGLGILVGDGRLPHPGPEYIVETYYKAKIWNGVFAGPDLQHISNPAYNRDRGPVWIPGFRFHAEF